MDTEIKNINKSNKALKIIIAIIVILVVSFIALDNFTTTYAWFSGSYSVGIDPSKKTFSQYTSSGEPIKTSKEYNEVLTITSGGIAVIDNDGYVKIVDEDDNVVATFEEKHPEAIYQTSTVLFSKPNIVRLHFIDMGNNATNIDYCYDTETGKTFIETR